MKTTQKLLVLLLTLLCVLSLAACGNHTATEQNDIWSTATYTENTTLGNGATAVTVEVTADDKTVTFTLNTDAETVGDALFEQQLITGEEGDYGLYIKTVNGILADYDVDQTYWAFYINGEYATSGVDTTAVTEGAVYQLVRSK